MFGSTRLHALGRKEQLAANALEPADAIRKKVGTLSVEGVLAHARRDACLSIAQAIPRLPNPLPIEEARLSDECTAIARFHAGLLLRRE